MAFIKNILQGFLGLKKDPNATTQDTAVIKSEDTNSGIAIVPNGTGAFTLNVPDGTATGGNARGQYAVDFQRVRSSADQVASGSYSLVLGSNNKASTGSVAIGSNNSANTVRGLLFGSLNTHTAGYNSIVVGYQNSLSTSASAVFGNNNTVSGSGDGNFVGGYFNNVNSVTSFCAGSNNSISSNYATISGGQSNTASTNTHATVVGGYQNSSTGQYSISGGYSNVASGQGSVALGYNNAASGQRSVALGRSYQQATADGSFAMGYYENIASGLGSVALGGSYNRAIAPGSFANGSSAKAYLTNQQARGGGFFEPIKAADGHVQFSYLTSRKEDTLTTGATTTLSLDGTGTTNLIIPNGNNRVWNVTIKYTAVVTSITGTATGVSVGDCKNEVLTIGFKKIGGTSSVVGSLNTLSTNEDSSMSTASFGVSAGSSQEMKLDFTAPTFTGGGSITTRVVAKVELTEVAY